MTRRVRFSLAALAGPFALAGCVSALAPPASLPPEAAVGACEGPAALALRARRPDVRSLALDPAPASRVEARATRVGSQPVALVVAGGGAGRTETARAPVRYFCLISPEGEAVFVDVELLDGDSGVLAACGPRPGSLASRTGVCLAGLLADAERALAQAEARAVERGRRAGAPARAAVDDPIATSIGAWRVYRDAECGRRVQDRPGPPAAEQVEVCRVELTRARVGELAG